MPNGATPSGTEKTGFVQKRYELKFITGGQPDDLEWEDAEVTARVRKPGTQEPIPIKRVTKLEDDSDHVLKIPDPDIIPTGGEMIEFKVGMNRDALDRLKPKLTPNPQGPLYQLNLEVDADPNLKSAMSTAMGAAMQMAPPGMGGMVSGAVLGSMKVSGSSQIAVEFPHPFIWHQLMDENFHYAGTTPTEIDTDDENGLQAGLHLREFSPKGGGSYQPGQEKLEVAQEGDGLDLLEDIVVDSKGVTLKSRRVLIGKPGDVQATENRIKLIPTWSPPPGSTKKPARNQATIEAHPPLFQFKAHTVDVTIEIYHNKDNETEPVLIQTLENQTLDGERAVVNCNGLPADFKGFLRWKITRKPKRFTADIFHMGMEEPLISRGSQVSATIELGQQGYKTEATPLNLTLQLPLHLQDLSIQISKTGWQTSQPVSLSAMDPQYAEFFKALEQGSASINLTVPHTLKEKFKDLDVSDEVLYPEVTVSGLSQSVGTVSYDGTGRPTVHIGAEGSDGYTLDLREQIQPLEINAPVLTPIETMGEKARETIQTLKTHEPRAESVLNKGLKKFRGEYLKDYVELKGNGPSGGQTLEDTADARKYALSSMVLMMDACREAPHLYKEFEQYYAIAFRSAVSCFFSTIVDGLLAVRSFRSSEKFLHWAASGQEVAEEAARQGVRELQEEGIDQASRAGAEAAEEGADQTARAGVEAAEEGADQTARAGAEAGEEGADQTARAGAEAAEEGAEDLSQLSAKELEEQLAEKRARKEASEKALQELKERHPNIHEEEKLLSKLSKEADEAFEQVKQAKEGVENELSEVGKNLDESKRIEKVLAETEKDVEKTRSAVEGMKNRGQEVSDLIKDQDAAVGAMEDQIDRAKEAAAALNAEKKALPAAIDQARDSADTWGKKLSDLETEMLRLKNELGDLTDPAEIDHTRQAMNRLSTRAHPIRKALRESENSLDTLKKKLGDVTREVAEQQSYREKLIETYVQKSDKLNVLKNELKKIEKELPAAAEALEQVKQTAKNYLDKSLVTESSEALAKKKLALERRLQKLAEEFDLKKRAAEQQKEQAEQALKIIQEMQKKDFDITQLTKEEQALYNELTKKRMKTDGAFSAVVPEGIKSAVDREHWLRRLAWNVLIGIPGIGQVVLFWKNLPQILALIGEAIEYVMRALALLMKQWDADIIKFSQMMERVLKKHHMTVDVQPVYGLKEDWVVSYVPRSTEKHIDPLARATAASEGSSSAAQEGRQNRRTLEGQIMNNVAVSLAASFQKACAYKTPEGLAHFTETGYEEAMSQVLGARSTLSTLIEQEADSKIRADAAYGWNPFTLGTTTWNDYVRIVDWVGWTGAWIMRIGAIFGGVTTAPTVVGPITAAGVFFGADVVDGLKSGIKTIFAFGGDANSKAKYLQIAVTYPCLAQGWLFEGMKDFSPQELRAVNTWDSLTKPEPLPDTNVIENSFRQFDGKLNAL